MRQRLARETERERAVHRRACEALLVRHQVVDALRHAELGEATLRLGEILAEHGANLMQQGYYLLVRNQLQRLPKRVLEMYPALLLMRTRCAIYDYDMEYFSGALAETEQWLPRLPIGIQKAMMLEMDLLRAQLALKSSGSGRSSLCQGTGQSRPRAAEGAGHRRGDPGRDPHLPRSPGEALELLGQSLVMAQAQNSHINVIWQLGQLAEAEINLLHLGSRGAVAAGRRRGASRHLLQLEVMEYIHRCWSKTGAAASRSSPGATLQRMEEIVSRCEEERWQYPLNSARLHLALKQGRLLDAQKWAAELERFGLRLSGAL